MGGITVVRFIVTGSRRAAVRLGEGRRYCLINNRVSVLPNEGSSEDWLHNNVNVLRTTETHT